MPPALRRYWPLLLLAVSLVWLCLDAPGPFWREAYFVLVMTGLTMATRTVAWRTIALALSLGIGVAAPLMVGTGWLFAAAGLDVSESGAGSWGVVPILEELVKLGTVGLALWLYRRKTALTFNPSDWLMAGCAVGAGFAMVENAELVRHDPSVLRDMARQYGPSWLVPGAWGAAGYVGHAAATGFAAAGLGLWSSMRRVAKTRDVNRSLSLGALIVPLAWVTLEHVLANLHVDTGARATFLLGNGRLTPWLFLLMTLVIVFNDYTCARRALEHSVTLRKRRAVVREALIGSRLPKRRAFWQRAAAFVAELRLVNAAAWASVERLTPGGKTR